MRRVGFLFLAVLALLGACVPDGDGDTRAPTPRPSATPVGTPDFRVELVPFFNGSCGAGLNDCHSRAVYAADVSRDCRGMLSLEDAALGAIFYSGTNAGMATGCPDRPLYERLLELAAWQCEDGTAYIEPGDPAASYLYRKLSGGPMCGTPSSPMPPVGSMSSAQVTALRLWILAGAPPITAPHPPTELEIMAMPSGLHLLWTDNSGNEDGFLVERRTGASTYERLGRTLPDEAQFHDDSVVDGVTYTYQVLATNAGGISAPSNEYSADGL